MRIVKSREAALRSPRKRDHTNFKSIRELCECCELGQLARATILSFAYVAQDVLSTCQVKTCAQWIDLADCFLSGR